MSLVVADCRRWQGHQPLSLVPLSALKQPRLPFVPKPVVSFRGRRQDSCLRPKSVAKMTRSASDLRPSTKASDEGKRIDKDERPAFHLDLAVLLAGFAFESYNTPPENQGVLEKDGRELRTTFLSREFVKSIYDGHMFVHLKHGVNFPGLNLWGTSDPYVEVRIANCAVRSKIIKRNNDPVWNEQLTLSMKRSAGHTLEVRAFNAKKFFLDVGESLGECSTPVDDLCDGKKHTISLDLEGPGGGGQLFLEVQYKSFAQIRVEVAEVGGEHIESQKWADFLFDESGLPVVEAQLEENQTIVAMEANGGVRGKVLDPFPGRRKVLEDILNKSQGENQGGGQKDPTATVSVTAATTNPISTEGVDVDIIQKKLFCSPERAIEAWVSLDKLAGTSFVKSDFEKICFVENKGTDTQVALWRDLKSKRMIVAFRGTQGTKLKDVITDLRLFAEGFNPETGRSNVEKQASVHAGFGDASDSVNDKLLSLVHASICSSIKPADQRHWHIYVTGHSLGGALATIFALNLAESDLAKDYNLRVTMYNFGSPRVGNRAFADKYNKKVKDTWRIVNHKDIVPTVPWLFGYCHVAQPLYLTADKSLVSDLLDDGYDGDVIGESALAHFIDNFKKGHLPKFLNRQISMLWAISDGSAVMEHMENFYYITLWQRVQSREGIYQNKDIKA